MLYTAFRTSFAGPDGQLPAELQKVEPAILELVCNEVVESGGTVVWDDIAGQDQAKRLIQELVVWPMKNPALFKVRRSALCCRLVQAEQLQVFAYRLQIYVCAL